MIYCIGPEQPCIWYPGIFRGAGQKGEERVGGEWEKGGEWTGRRAGAGARGGESKGGGGKAGEKSTVLLFEGGGKAGSAILF